VHPTYEFISFILGYGKDVRVISPPSLKEEVKTLIGKMAILYESENHHIHADDKAYL
jgi:predicted DNA-binding transcriptional regulator YafY